MAKKKSKQPPADDGAAPDETAPPAPAKANGSPEIIAPTPGASKGSKTPPGIPATPSSPALIICRNKHWRYISAFHGPWLQMPLEILETIANVNYNTPRPRPIDPAVYFDTLKVRRLVDEATNLAVRAASSIASPTLTSVHGGLLGGSSMNALETGSVHGAKLSRERKFRMREQASQKLARAYRLDEIACSVAAMQGSSPLEDVGSLVLQRSPGDCDARYVHFFHEKIPSRQMAEYTSLQPLNDIFADRPGEPEILRTRATVRVFKDDLEGAAQDLTQALSMCRFHQPSHKLSEEATTSQELSRNRRRLQDIILAEQDQPSGLDSQLLFQRAGVYLTMACNHVVSGLRYEEEQAGRKATTDATTGPGEANGVGAKSETDQDLSNKIEESRKLAKTLARRALRDYLSFISQFDYSPNLPIRVAKEFNDRVNLAAHGTRNPRQSEPSSPVESHTVYSLSELFAAVAPADLPPYPAQDVINHGSATPPPDSSTCEWATYHPLLADALHSLLLCHCLTQTSAKELQRHAHMVARIVRLTDGYPIFQASRSPARADWIEVLRRTQNWIQLASSWESLCAPAPLPIYDAQSKPKPAPLPSRAASAAAAIASGSSPDAVTEEQRKDAVRQHAILDALDDERVTDEASFRVAVQAREARAERDRFLQPPTPVGAAHPYGTPPAADPALRRWSAEDGKEYPILSDRAAAVALWVIEAPQVTGLTRRKKRTKKPAAAAAGTSKMDDADGGMGKLDLEDQAET